MQDIAKVLTVARGARAVLLKRRGNVFTPIVAVSILAGRPRTSGALSSSGEPSTLALERVLRTRRFVRIPRPKVSGGRNARGVFGELYLPIIQSGGLRAVLYVQCRDVSSSLSSERCNFAVLLASPLATTILLLDEHESEVRALQARVNPAFLHNSFSVIAQLAPADPARAEQAIVMLSRLYRYVVGSSSDRIVTLAQEVARNRDYLDLEKFRLGDRIRASIAIDGPIENVHIPCLLLHSLVESSISHGVSTKLGGGVVKVAVSVTPTDCRISVEDDGLSWEERSAQADPGLRLLRRRLRRHYGRKHTLHIRKQNGLAVEVCIPRGR